MKKYTQEEFDAIPRDEYSIKHCPTGDYSLINSFGEGCGFGEGCSFGERCSFGESCGFGKFCNFENNKVINGKYFAVDRIGSESRKTYFFIDENQDMFVRSGCFSGTLDEFKTRVKETRGGTIYEKQYLMACDLAEVVFGG